MTEPASVIAMRQLIEEALTPPDTGEPVRDDPRA